MDKKKLGASLEKKASDLLDRYLGYQYPNSKINKDSPTPYREALLDYLNNECDSWRRDNIVDRNNWLRIERKEGKKVAVCDMYA